MIDFVFEYLEQHGVIFLSAKEVQTAEAGIRLYLAENGIPEHDTRAYFRSYLEEALKKIRPSDLKGYFLHYPALSQVRQICIEAAAGDPLSNDRKNQLRTSMAELYDAEGMENYVPLSEVALILERFS